KRTLQLGVDVDLVAVDVNERKNVPCWQPYGHLVFDLLGAHDTFRTHLVPPNCGSGFTSWRLLTRRVRKPHPLANSFKTVKRRRWKTVTFGAAVILGYAMRELRFRAGTVRACGRKVDLLDSLAVRPDHERGED